MELTPLTKSELAELEHLRLGARARGTRLGLLFLSASLILMLVAPLTVAAAPATVFSGVLAAFGFGMVVQR